MCGGMKLKFIVVRLYCILASTMPSLKELEQGFFLCYWNIFIRHIGREYLRVSVRRTFEFTSILHNILYSKMCSICGDNFRNHFSFYYKSPPQMRIERILEYSMLIKEFTPH